MSNRLREILLENRRNMQMAEFVPCPFCQNHNPGCQYFELVAEPVETAPVSANPLNSELGEFPADSFWGRVKQALMGTSIPLKTAEGETTFDLGDSMHCSSYYLDLCSPWDEIPMVNEIANKFGFSEYLDEKVEKRSSSRFMAVPVAVLQSKEADLTAVDEDAREMMDLEFSLAIDNAAEGKILVNYQDYEWMPCYFDPKEPEIPIPGEGLKDKPNALALVNWKGIYVFEEAIYRRWADMEERLFMANVPGNSPDRKYECSDIQKARQDFIKEWTEMREELKSWMPDE